MSETRGGEESNVAIEAAPAPPAPWTDRVSDTLQNVIKAGIGANRRPPRRLKSLLHGTGLGHPLHPAITDVPIGTWLLAALFDILWLVSPAGNAWAARGAQVLVLAGVVAALGAAVTGMADWSDSYGAERTVGLYHGALNLLATLLYIVSVVMRFQVASGENVAAAVVGFVGLACVLVAAYLGGDMVFAKGTSVNHTAWEAAGEDYEPVLSVEQAQEQALNRVMVAGVPVLLVRLGERYYAIAATCTHAGGPLDEGELQGDVVQCPWHGSRFRLRDGAAVTGPATVAQPRYDVRVRGGQIELKRIGGH
jgi:nitrite reductase/ring-hydroxylating ferredoxin subunit/uncharacterized membrane protein